MRYMKIQSSEVELSHKPEKGMQKKMSTEYRICFTISLVFQISNTYMTLKDAISETSI